MEVIKEKCKVLNKALKTLNESLEQFKKPMDESLKVMVRDSAIQRFEYCIELFWKYVKAYLQEQEKMELKKISPRAIIRDTHACCWLN